MGDRRNPRWTMLSRAWTAEIVVLLAPEPLHFNAIKRRLDDVPASTLSARLDDLRSEGFVRRRESGDRPERVHYSLTARGRALYEKLATVEAIEYVDRP